MRAKKMIAAVLVALLSLTSLAACGSTATQAPTTTQEQATTEATTAATTQGTETTEATPVGRQPLPDQPEYWLKFGTTGFDGKFNPIMADNVYDDYVVKLIFQDLIDNTPEGEYVPGDIASWTLSDDHLTYTFTLVDGVKFADGTPMTSADVEFTYTTMGNPAYDGPRAYAVERLVGYEDYSSGKTDVFEGIKVIDDKTISFTFKEGEAAPANIESFAYSIMPKHYYQFDTWQDFLALIDKPLGSGYFKLDSWAPNENIVLSRNDNYWDEGNGVLIPGVMFLNVPPESLAGAIQTEQVDLVNPGASVNALDTLEAMPSVHVYNFLSNGYTYLDFNCTRPQFQDKRVRQALLYALDRKTFISIQYGADLGNVGLAPISPTSWAFPDLSELNPYDFDMDKAKALMDEAGWVVGADGIREKDGVKMSISWLVYTDSAWPGVLSEMAADSWKELGVDLKIELMDFVTVQSRVSEPEPKDKNFDIYTMGFSLSLDPDPSGTMFDYNAYRSGGFCTSGYYNEHSQDLISRGRGTFDTAERATIYKEWAKLMNEEVSTVIVAYRHEIWAATNRVKGMDIQTNKTWVQSIKDVYFE